MKDQGKAKEELMRELAEFRQQVVELEALEADRRQTEDALKRSTEFSQIVLNSMNDGICIISVSDFSIVGCNSVFLRQVDLKEEEVIGKTCYEITHHRSEPCRPPDHICPLLDTAARGRYSVAEHVHHSKDGEEIHVEVSTSPIKNEDGKTIQVIYVSRDITERKLAEETLRRSEKQYRELIETLQEGIWVIDKEAYTTLVNPRMAEMLRYTVDEMQGKHLFSFMDRRGVEIAERNLKRREHGIKEQHDFEFLRKDGTRLYASLETSPITDDDGNYVGAIAGVQDITRRRRAEEALREYTHALGERVKELNCLYGISRLIEKPGISLPGILQGVVDLIPPAWQYPEITCARLTVEDQEFQTENYAETTWQQFADISVHGERVGALQVCYLEERPESYEGPFLKEERFLINAIAERLGRIIERKRAQDALKEYSERLEEMVEERTKELRDAQEELVRKEKLALTGKLAASLAHEINNPLQTVIGCLGLAEETLAAGGDVNRYLRIGREELQRAARIVAQLRDLQRRSKPEEREPTDVNALLERVLMLSRKQCEEREVEVVWKAASDLPPLMLVPDRMQQVFLNLVLNALDAMPEGGRLEVSAARSSQPDEVRVSFTDSGRGIAPDVLPAIFDAFYSTKPEGLGLGLFVSQNIVEEHGGRIEVESRLGEGTTFTVWLPV